MVATVPLPMLERADIQVEEKADVVLDEKETSEGFIGAAGLGKGGHLGGAGG